MEKTIVTITDLKLGDYFELETGKCIYRAPWLNDLLLLWRDNKDGTKVLALRKVETVTL